MCTSSNCPHDDLNDDFSDLFGGDIGSTESAATFAKDVLSRNVTSTVTFEEKCRDCRGTGSFYSYTGRYVGQCFKCKGAGVRRYKTTTEQREKAADQRAEKKARDEQTARDSAQAWRDANPAEAEWLRDAVARGFEFGVSLNEALNKYGHFTEKQEAAVRRLTVQSAERKAQWATERADRDANKATVEIDRIQQSFDAAKASRLKWPKLRLDTFLFSLAGENSRNAGAIYVKDQNDTYLGKITEGKFTRSRDCDAEIEQRIIAVCADPAAAATAYGQRTGQCSCCGRELTNAESIARAIGPICAERWGW